MDLDLHIWRQRNRLAKGRMAHYKLQDVAEDISFLEMMDKLNLQIIKSKDIDGPVAFESDCREGICGACGVMINGRPHGPYSGLTTCQLHMRSFIKDTTLYIEPFRARAFPIIQDLIIDRSSFDRIIQAGGYVSVNTGSAPEANAIPISKKISDMAMDNAACIGCGACVAICKNASAMLFTSAKVAHLNMLPQGQPERKARVKNMLFAMKSEGFGNCTNEGECEAVCPKQISHASIAKLNREYISSLLKADEI